MSRYFLLLSLIACLAGCAIRQEPAPQAVAPTRWPGQKPDGSVLLPNQWSLRPVGKQVPLGDFPVNMAVHPDGKTVAVLHSGHSAHEIRIIDIKSAAEVSRTAVKETFYGLEFSADGRTLFCSGASEELVHAFDYKEGALQNHRKFPLRDPAQTGVPAGLAVSPDGSHLFVANVWGHRVTRVDLSSTPKVTDLAVGTPTNTIVRPGAIPSADDDTAAANKRAEVDLFDTKPGDTFPYACRYDASRHRLYVSLWAQSAVAVLDTMTGKVLERWATEEHPCEMALTRSGRLLYVANANHNTVSVFETATGRHLETIWAAPYASAPPGSTPNSLALTPDEKTLFVANACNNMVAAFDVSRPGKSRSLGFIPVGWYPTSVRVSRDGSTLLVANGKGLISRANPKGPQPGAKARGETIDQYIARLFTGSLSLIPLQRGKDLESQMRAFTAQALATSPLKPDASVTTRRPEGNPVPQKPGQPSPIKYCIYLIKENRTYDQVFGDMPEGNGDPNLCLFPDQITPNHHALAREFGLLDNFYVESEVSADGHEWTMGAYASDFVEKTWPLSYGHGRSGKYPYPSEGHFDIAFPAGGYLWDRAREAGVSYRSYGEFTINGKTPSDPTRTRVKSLAGHIDPGFRGFDMNYPDVKRAERFISEWRRYEKEGGMPQLQIVRLPNDHTHGTSPQFFTPRAYLADNDLALGMIVEAVSQSSLWGQTAIFVVEDDAQNGPDHVDAHRTVGLVISAYSRRGQVNSAMYSTSSMLRTIELILGLKPMSQFDAAALPMYACFQNTPDLRPYQCRAARIDLTEKNSPQAWGGQIKMNFAREDAADDLLLNEIVWRSVKGPTSPMPAPVRAAFVFPAGTEDDDD
jgi:DNA-binding beta-propeller fold protein YncE/phospholipase C